MKEDNSMHMLLIALVIIVLIIQVASLAKIYSIQQVQPYNKTNGGGTSQVSITASGTTSAQPTQGSVYINAEGKGLTAAAATANLSSALNKLNSSILGYLNGNLSLIQTTYYNVYNESGYYSTYNGFVASEQLTIMVPNFQNVSKIVGALSSINAIMVSSSEASLSNQQMTSLRNAAYSAALQNATSQAEILTSNATLSVYNITVNAYRFYPIPLGAGVSAAAAPSIANSSAVNPQFYSGKESVTESITVVFQYARKPV